MENNNQPLSREELVSVLEAIKVIATTFGGQVHYRIKELVNTALKNEVMKPDDKQYNSVGEELESLRKRAMVSERALVKSLLEESKTLWEVKPGKVYVGNIIREAAFNKPPFRLWTVVRVVEKGIVVESRQLSNPHQSLLDWAFLEKNKFIVVS